MVYPSWLIQPLHDFATGAAWYKWFKLALNWGKDLDFVECGQPCDTPKEWVQEKKEVAWAELFSRDVDIDTKIWGVTHGVCPGQPFLVELKNPIYSEDDVRYPYNVRYRMPRTPEQALRSWEKWQKLNDREWKKASTKSARRLELAIKPRNMHLSKDFWGLRLEGYSDIGQGKQSVLLVSTEVSQEQQKSPEDCAKAVTRLIKGFARRHPCKPMPSWQRLYEESGLPPLSRLAMIALEVSSQTYSSLPVPLL